VSATQRSIAGRATRAPYERYSVTIQFTHSERLFILHRLGAVSQVVEAIIHPVRPLVMRPQWERQQLVRCAWDLIGVLRQRSTMTIRLPSASRQALLVEAIEGNCYFVRPLGDPRLNLAHIRQAEALRLKLEKALRCKIRRFQIGPAP
jgi:hypothetical protein